MDVHLLVYDLSQGLARQMSMGILGFQLDAIYHTSIELEGREYVYDGGIIAIVPGSSHLGQPLERLHLGQTDVPLDVVEEYIESVRPIFTVEAYDLFHHNCNNFTDSFSNFLLGKGIPSHITSMPQAVLDSPMGRMLVPQLMQGVNAGRQNGSILGLGQSGQQAGGKPRTSSGVWDVSSSTELSSALGSAGKSGAIIFFTSVTCGPCKALYPAFDQLAEEHQGKVTCIKVDISQPQAQAIASQYGIRATPTFVTFLRGQQEDRWTGSTPGDLSGRVRLLAHMASLTHPHHSLRLPSFASAGTKPVMYTKAPPMAKLMAKMGDELAGASGVQSLRTFIEEREAKGAVDAVVPDLASLSDFLRKSVADRSPETLFGVVDLFRCALVDPRVSGYFAEEADQKTVRAILELVNSGSSCPYALRLVTLQMACNLFSTSLFAHQVLLNPNTSSNLVPSITQLITSSFLDESHNSIRVAASSLLFNLALESREARRKASPSQLQGLPEADQVELAASVVEAIGQEDKSVEALQGMLSALGHLFYEADLDGELADLLRTLDAAGTILSKKKDFASEKLVTEVGGELLGKGLRKP
ncbi:PUL domain [Geosmithia morbida]|uniref:PUL domain n=1 Tax=Geosmithia morbida TaxID=1094350 RepID=A0A9P4YS38_9HYPO|nr:PUL domain [Geosmithia morbida]KAF4120817.1 PUL domain [Geosmithia morbida]